MTLPNPPENLAVSGAADPLGQVMGAEEVSVANEPAPVSKGFITAYACTMLALNLVMIMPALFSLAFKIQLLDPAGKEASLGVVVGLGALVNMIATPIFGVLSDHTRVRWGRRRPWIAAGIILSTGAGFALAVSPSVLALGAVWMVYQVGVAAMLSSLTAVLADQIPLSQRGIVGALTGVSAQLAGVAGTLLGSVLTGSVLLMFLLPPIALAVCFVFYLIAVPDSPAPASTDRQPITQVFRELLFDPRKHRDYTFVWLGRFLFMSGVSFFSTYQLYFLLDRLGLTAETAGQNLAIVGGLGIVVTTGFAVIGGILSDRLRRRKPFIYVASALAAAGLILMAFAHDVIIFGCAALLIVAAAGLFGSVDLALASDVVPDRTQAGRWMSILNVSGSLAQSVIPVIAPPVLMAGGGQNYTVLYLTAAVVATGAGITAWQVRAVR